MDKREWYRNARKRYENDSLFTLIHYLSSEPQQGVPGRSGGIRTRGLMDPNHARYQTSPHPDSGDIIMNILYFVKGKWTIFAAKGFPAPCLHRIARGDSLAQ